MEEKKKGVLRFLSSPRADIRGKQHPAPRHRQ